MTDVPPEGIVVFITAPTNEEAARLAEMLVARRLAGCVQVLPGLKSVYRWQGQIERQEEVLLIAKTLNEKFGELSREVTALHSYAAPEIVAMPIISGAGPYLEWLMASVNPDSE